MDPIERSSPAAQDGAGQPAPEVTTTRTQESAVAREPVGPATALPRGATLGRYVVLEYVGAGGMGVVYAAYDFGLDRKVSLKLVRGERHGKERQERLVREAQAMARLSHPNVIAVHDVGTYEDQVFIAMEFVAGGTLKHWLRSAPRGRAEVVERFLQAGRGLAAAHRAGLVHRDFKPENVLMGEDGRCRVTDFGLAVPATASTQGPGTPTPAAGTAAYMSPEQRQGRAVDPRSDQYAFCVALHEGLCGERPSSPAPTPALAAAGAPRALWRVLERGLSAEPDARFPSLDALLAELERGPRRERARVALAGGLGLAGSVAALGVWAVLSRPPAPSAPLACESAPVLSAPLWKPSDVPACEGPDVPAMERPRARVQLAPELAEGLAILASSPVEPEKRESRPLDVHPAASPVQLVTGAPGHPKAASPSSPTVRSSLSAPPSRARAQARSWEDEAHELIERFRRDGVGEHPLGKLVARVMDRLERLLGGTAELDEPSALALGGGERAEEESARLAAFQRQQAIALGGTIVGASVTQAPLSGHKAVTDKRAVETLERAVALHEAAQSPPAELAEARFALAQALWETEKDQDRALELARKAKEELADAQAATELKVEVSSWLKEKLELRHNRPERNGW
ncbi:MAG TPA: serine/threonine-protein kinase [Longimicrobium sp.]|nr:serine/threonine-protein kinase [Longimicrobium sp.]